MAKSPWKPKFLPFDEIIESAKRRVPVLPEVFFNEIPQAARPFAFTSTLIEKQSQIGEVLRSLNTALENGESFENWKNSVQIDRFESLADFRKEAIFRTHMQTAYNQGTFQVAQELKSINPYLRYSAVLDDRTRPNHEALDGVIRRVDDAFWTNNLPPNGINCRCEVVSLGQGDELKDLGGPTTKGQLEEIQKVGKPDKGWNHDKTNPQAAIDRHFRRKNKSLPRSLRDTFLRNFFKKKDDTEVWWQKNQALFTEE